MRGEQKVETNDGKFGRRRISKQSGQLLSLKALREKVPATKQRPADIVPATVDIYCLELEL